MKVVELQTKAEARQTVDAFCGFGNDQVVGILSAKVVKSTRSSAEEAPGHKYNRARNEASE
jgi:hypothetical protein